MDGDQTLTGGTPELRQIWKLGPDDFERHPVWACVHGVDQHEPWYRGTDEATYRPWSGEFRASPARAIVARAEFTLLDESRLDGFATVLREDWDVPPPRKMPDRTLVQRRSFTERSGGSPAAILGLQQPRVFVDGQQINFWGGMRGVSAEQRQAFYLAIGKSAPDIFPIRFVIDPALATGVLSGVIDGFYRHYIDEAPVVEV